MIIIPVLIYNGVYFDIWDCIHLNSKLNQRILMMGILPLTLSDINYSFYSKFVKKCFNLFWY